MKATGLPVIPVIYVNDNFGKWQSDFRKLVERCLAGSCRGKQITELLHPHDDDYFVLKPKRIQASLRLLWSFCSNLWGRIA